MGRNTYSYFIFAYRVELYQRVLFFFVLLVSYFFFFFFFFSILFAVDRLIPDTGWSHKRRIYCFSGGIRDNGETHGTENRDKERGEKGREKIGRQKWRREERILVWL